jgi:hypothetical protein
MDKSSSDVIIEKFAENEIQQLLLKLLSVNESSCHKKRFTLA